MQHFIDIRQIEARGKAIGLELAAIARMAGVNPITAWRGARGKVDPRASTVRKLLETLELQEARVRKHLAELERSGGGRQMDMLNNKRAII
jgi:predicted transcriptional regulator